MLIFLIYILNKRNKCHEFQSLLNIATRELTQKRQGRAQLHIIFKFLPTILFGTKQI